MHNDLKVKKIEIDSLKEFASSISIWDEKFYEANHDKKKVMLRNIIDYIEVFRDSVDIKFKLDVAQFLSDCGNGSVFELRGRAHRWQR